MAFSGKIVAPANKILDFNNPLCDTRNMNLRGLISNSQFYDLAEKIANLIDENLNTTVDDLTHINDLIYKEIENAYHAENANAIFHDTNGGSK